MTYVGAVRAALAAAGDPARAAQQQAYMKSDLPYVGLTAPELKALLRPAPGRAPLRRPRRVGGRRAASCGTDATHREEWYAAIALLRHRPTAPGSTPTCCRCSSTSCAPARGGTSSTRSRPTSSGRCCSTTARRSTPVMDDVGGRRPPLGPAYARCSRQLRHRERDRHRPARAGARRQPRRHGVRARSSSSARRSAGRCASTRRRTRRGSATSSRTHADRLSGLSRREALKHLG